jgi:hypothetical protein
MTLCVHYHTESAGTRGRLARIDAIASGVSPGASGTAPGLAGGMDSGTAFPQLTSKLLRAAAGMQGLLVSEVMSLKRRNATSRRGWLELISDIFRYCPGFKVNKTGVATLGGDYRQHTLDSR